MSFEQYDSNVDEKINILANLIKNKWDSLRKNIEYLLKHMNENSKMYLQIKNAKEQIFMEDNTQENLEFYKKIDLITIQKLNLLNKKIRKCFTSSSAKFNSIFSLIDDSISQIEKYLHQKDQVGEYSQNLNSNDAVREIFLDNMRKGITSDQLKNFEARKQLKRKNESIEVLDSLTQKNLKYIAHSLLMYQEYRLKIESPQDSAKIEKRMFKSSLDLIFVSNSMTCPDNKP